MKNRKYNPPHLTMGMMNNKQGKKRPNRWAEALLSRLLPERERMDLLGDYEEVYREMANAYGRFIACFWYGMQIVVQISKYYCDSIKGSVIMFKNYLITALRNIKKHKGHSFINILGLAIGLACFILILLYIQYELSYDKYHENNGNIYRIVSEDRGRLYMNSFKWAQSHPAVAYHARQEIPKIQKAVRLLHRNEVPFKIDHHRYLVDNFYFAEPDLFQVFSFPLLKGDSNTMLSNPHSILLSTSLAAKFCLSDWV